MRTAFYLLLYCVYAEIDPGDWSAHHLAEMTGTEYDPLWRAKDTINWFAGTAVFDGGSITLGW
jgi:hypothetical protein